ncbi:MAG TPA: HAD-IA family hydrolase [Chloroflexota bacterium]|nr:HAD-IA family hydrolase [Chloroflexota bacterium]
MPRLQVDAVLFDMDGTLVDDRVSYWEAIRRTASFLLTQPVELDEVAQIKALPGFNNDLDTVWALVGRRMHGTIRAPDAADRGSYAFRRLRNVFQTFYLGDRLWQELSGEEPPFAWTEPLMLRETLLMALDTLERLRRYRLGIATSRPRAEALMALQRFGLDRFIAPDAVVAVEDAPHEKPHPAPLLEVARRVAAAHPAYVGDSISDAIAAFGAGMVFIHVGRERFADEKIERQVAHRVASVDDLLALLDDVEVSQSGT